MQFAIRFTVSNPFYEHLADFRKPQTYSLLNICDHTYVLLLLYVKFIQIEVSENMSKQ